MKIKWNRRTSNFDCAIASWKGIFGRKIFSVVPDINSKLFPKVKLWSGWIKIKSRSAKIGRGDSGYSSGSIHAKVMTSGCLFEKTFNWNEIIELLKISWWFIQYNL
jgi:hypothetical protein